MNDFTRVNAPRVEKMVAMLETIFKSARSNRVDDRDVQQLLAPLRDAERQLTTPLLMPPGIDAPVPSAGRDTKERRDITLWNEAKTAPLDELMMAYTTITSRLADLVDENK